MDCNCNFGLQLSLWIHLKNLQVMPCMPPVYQPPLIAFLIQLNFLSVSHILSPDPWWFPDTTESQKGNKNCMEQHKDKQGVRQEQSQA